MTLPHGQLETGLTNLSIRLVQTLAKQQREFAELGLHEVTQQFQIDVSGTTGGDGKLLWGRKDIPFGYPFSFAPTRRRSDLVLPHFTFGIYIALEDPDTGDPLTTFPNVLLTAVASHYARDPDTDEFTGVRVNIGAVVPGETTPTDWQASMHLDFQGMAAEHEDETDL